jgi:hypothetical protein
MMNTQYRLSRRHTPNAIWFQSIPDYEAAVSVVNGMYRYEIFGRSSGTRIFMDSMGSLAQAKTRVFDIFAELRHITD